jgi:hypothetical protein
MAPVLSDTVAATAAAFDAAANASLVPITQVSPALAFAPPGFSIPYQMRGV